MTFSQALATIFRNIGSDVAAAARRQDKTAFDALVALTIALENAYPGEMKRLREEDA